MPSPRITSARSASHPLAAAVALSVVSASVHAAAEKPTPVAPATAKTARPRRLGSSFGAPTRFDVNVEGGIGSLRGHEGLAGFGRIRLGVLRILESPVDPNASPLFVTVGATYEVSSLSVATLGVQTELTHVASGFWGQFGALVDVAKPAPGFMAALGWNVLAVEAQRRPYAHDNGGNTNDWALFAKLRLPVSLLFGSF